jgi:serpin B
MTYTGARGETESQMAHALHFSLPQERLHAAFSGLLKDLNNAKGYELAVANRLWGQKNYPFLKSFLDFIDAHYRGGFQEVDYIDNREESRRMINQWVEAQTKQKIKELLLKEDLKPATRLVLTNAIYFKGSWRAKFDSQKTVRAPFLLENGDTAQASFMTQSGLFRYYGNKDLELLELPYAGDRLSMIVLLPQKGVGLEKIESLLSADTLRSWRSEMTEMEVRVFLPRFRTETRFELNAPLTALGMPDPFDEELADFSGIMGKKDLYISKVIHKAFVDVNEEGTEAAAATAVVMDTKSLRMEINFRADRPFVYAIVDGRSGSVLFLGRLMNPQSVE